MLDWDKQLDFLPKEGRIALIGEARRLRPGTEKVMQIVHRGWHYDIRVRREDNEGLIKIESL